MRSEVLNTITRSPSDEPGKASAATASPFFELWTPITMDRLQLLRALFQGYPQYIEPEFQSIVSTGYHSQDIA